MTNNALKILNQNSASILASLNEEQRVACLHDQGPLVIFAGAGSGKTRVITARIALLLENGVRPSQILAMTFTNKAAKEMKERIAALSLSSSWVHVGTFHSSCVRWLREFASQLGFRNDFIIYDTKDSIAALKSIIKNDFNLSFDKHVVAEYERAIQQAKTLCLTPQDVQAKPPRFFPEFGAKIYERYQLYLLQCNAMDFSDLMMHMVHLLRQNGQIRSLLQERYRYILVDEYQDTNPTQFALISLLTNNEGNICVVGDDDQSIYSWRGADPSNILTFTQRYQSAQMIKLEQNYRCSGTIIKAANALIQNNKYRAEKKLWTQNEAGEPLHFQLCYDGELEASAIVDLLLKERQEYPFFNTAIFYRTNAQSRAIEDNLRRAQVPYRIYGSLRFYDRAEIKDMIAYLRVILNTSDDMAFSRIVNVPPRGIGAKGLEDIEMAARSQNISLLQACEGLAKESSRGGKKFQALVSSFHELVKDLQQVRLESLLPSLLQKLDYKQYLVEKFPSQAEEKLANIHELGAAISEWSGKHPGAGLSEWLLESALGGSEEEGQDGVSLMTLHSAKGLEFDRVYIAGVEDGLLPHRNSVENPENLEEERRLFYVGMTRAKQKLSLLCARKRRVYNQWMTNPVSRFLRELPAGMIRELSSSSVSMSSAIKIKAGSLVSHPTFGKGVVEEVGEEFGAIKAVVDFKDFGQRKITASHLKTISGMD